MSVSSDTTVLTESSAVPAGKTMRQGSSTRLDVAVVICAYTQERWDQTVAAVQSVVSQQPGPSQVLLVVDHNAALAARARRELPDVTVLESEGLPGLSGARNTGLSASGFSITAFLDDDAAARPGWLAYLIEPYRDSDVVATGGSINPVWLADRPRWLPPEFYWVVGCSYRGLPDSTDTVRNPIGANMSLRTAPALGAGGFYRAVGRTNSRLGGCEETELAIRLSARQPGSVVVYIPEAAVDHNIGYERVKFSYFLRRCWHEGWSKATVVKLVGLRAGLEAERRHVASVLPAGMCRDLRDFASGDFSALLRSCATALGLMAASSGFLARSVGPREPLRLREQGRSKH
jgi:glycosyltransferase involved in cell wall biosynthesis